MLPPELPAGRGRDAFVRDRCWACHDFTRDGALVSDGWYRALAKDPALVFGPGTTHSRVDAEIVPYLRQFRDMRPRVERDVDLPMRPVRDASRGAALYAMHCTSCHGTSGRGDGPAASCFETEVAPRDLTRAMYRTRSTDDLPLDEDLFRTITRGMFGSAMAPHAGLPDDDRWHLVDHVKSLAWNGSFNPFDRRAREPVVVGEPLPPTPERIEYGRRLTMQVDCRICHGDDFAGREREGRFNWTDEAERPFPRSADLTRGVFKSGSSPRDLYRSLFLGRGGSPMPAYGPLFHSEEKRWSIVAFVQSLRK